jgi:ribosomal protein S18 acetylase RimI-like enzyme
VDPIRIRVAARDDQPTMYEICRLTGDAGADATGLHDDPDLLGAVYVGPYLALEPELAFVGVDDTGVAGYVLGAADTATFEADCEQRWWPALRDRYPEPPASGPRTADEKLHQLIHHPRRISPTLLDRYPAHLHIDLHPRAQGRGLGRRLMEILLDALRDRGAPGVHLGVAAANHRAIGFYTHLGFDRIGPGAGGILFARRL